eukprot:1034299-Rhodomonas_salina.1
MFICLPQVLKGMPVHKVGTLLALALAGIPDEDYGLPPLTVASSESSDGCHYGDDQLVCPEEGKEGDSQGVGTVPVTSGCALQPVTCGQRTATSDL